MPYDDPILKELGGYFKAEEPGRRERAEAWATAIGLQKVDGLTPSQFLFDTARDHIEGRITQNQARRRIRDYYAQERRVGDAAPYQDVKKKITRLDRGKEEADKVSERIVAVLNDGGFAFTPEYFISIHAKLFKGVLPTAGKIRSVNIRKREWVLKDESVTYGDAASIRQSLVRDFIDEREFDYGGKTPRKIIPHFARFIAQIWQVHPFGEGNTRTTAVFTIKYLRSLGFAVDNDAFRDNAWYFRNALVRANYADYAHDVKREWSYLEAFFRNLLLGERNELKSRYLLIGLTNEDRQKIRELTDPGGCQKKAGRKRGKKTTQKTTQKMAGRTTQKTALKILSILRRNPNATRKDIVVVTGLTEDGVKWNLRKLKAAGRLRRIGPDKGGHWEVVEGGGE